MPFREGETIGMQLLLTVTRSSLVVLASCAAPLQIPEQFKLHKGRMEKRLRELLHE